jgi:hypothetical protein
MAGNGSPDSPIVAVRVPDAEPVAAAAMPPAAAASPEPAAAAPAAAAAAPIPEAPAIELVGERPSLLESFGKEAKPVDKPAADIVKPEAAADKPKDGDVKPAEAKAADAKPADAKPADAPKPEDAAKPEGEAKPLDAKPEPLAPIEYVYELPNTLKMDDGLKTELHTALDAFRADPAKGAQPLIDLHNKLVSDFITQNAEATLRNQHKAFNDTRSQWNTDWAADPEIGGSGYQTSMRAIARMRDQFVSDALPGTAKYQTDLKGFEDFLRITGAGDHPAFGRFLHNVARAFDEPAPPPVNTKPPPNHGQKPGSSKEKLYGPSQKAS